MKGHGAKQACNRLDDFVRSLYAFSDSSEICQRTSKSLTQQKVLLEKKIVTAF